MAIINLLTDYQYDPLYTSILVNYLRLNTSAKIFESTHNLPFYNLNTAGFIIRSIYKHLPARTIHLICTKTSQADIKQYLAFEHNKHYFLVADNGLVNIITEGRQVVVYQLLYKLSTFAELDILAPAAIKLAKNFDLMSLGDPTTDYKKINPILPGIFGNQIRGTVIYIDKYGNIITNISKEFFERHRKGRKYKIWINLPINLVNKIDSQYRSKPGEFIAIFNYFGLLEISVISGNAAKMLNLREGESEVVIEFF